MEQSGLTRDMAIEQAGVGLVEAVDAKNCEPTNRVGYNGACQGDALTEWSASVKLEDGTILTAYYYTTNDQDEVMAANDGDGASIDWTVDHYSLI